MNCTTLRVGPVLCVLMETPLLRQPARRAPAAVAALAVAAVTLLVLASLTVHARPLLLQIRQAKEYAAANGEKCWMCPCCAGCESTGAARAAGCFVPGSKAARKGAPVKAAKTSRKQATLHSVADAEPQADAVAARVQASAKPAAKPKQVVQAAKTAEVGQVKSSGNFQHDDGSLFGDGTFKSAEAAPSRIARRSKLDSVLPPGSAQAASQQDNDEDDYCVDENGKKVDCNDDDYCVDENGGKVNCGDDYYCVDEQGNEVPCEDEEEEKGRGLPMPQTHHEEPRGAGGVAASSSKHRDKWWG